MSAIDIETKRKLREMGAQPLLDAIWAVSRNVDSSSVISELSGRPG